MALLGYPKEDLVVEYPQPGIGLLPPGIGLLPPEPYSQPY